MSSRSVNASSMVVCSWMLALSSVAPAWAEPGGAGSALQQYTSGGHVLGFGAGGYYVSDGTYALKVEFLGAVAVEPVAEAGERKTAGGAARLGRVRYAGLWEGIDATCDAPGSGIVRTTWHLAPGADPGAIRLRYSRPVQRSADGTLAVAAYATGVASESAPVAWQEVQGERRPVEVAFVVRGGQEVGFEVGAYDRARPLVIDPTLVWNTFLGGSGTDSGSGIAVDGSGSVYVTGTSNATWGSPVRSYTADSDAFAAKLDASGALLWNTFLGGSGGDHGFAIATDGSGGVYVTGQSDATWGSPVRAYTTLIDAFAANLDPSGTLVWNTFLGSSAEDGGQGIAVDASGNVYVAGASNETWGSPVQGMTGLSFDAFAAKLDPSGALLWNTFLGGVPDDLGSDIAVDGSGNVYVAGLSTGTWGSPVRAYTAGPDTFVAELDPGGALLWNTFLGGSGGDQGRGIAVDGSGNVYVAGDSTATWGSPVRAHTASSDAFAAKLDPSGAILWNTFLGGSGIDQGYGIAVDGSGSVFVAGESLTTWGSPVRAYTAGQDAYAARLDPSGAILWNTFLGGSGGDAGLGIAVDGSGGVYVTGVSTATWGSPVRAYTAGRDAFAARLAAQSPLEIPILSGAGVVVLVLLLAAAASVALRWGAAS